LDDWRARDCLPFGNRQRLIWQPLDLANFVVAEIASSPRAESVAVVEAEARGRHACRL
jgi:hypothetical protein